MGRILLLIGLSAIACLGGALVFGAVRDPFAANREYLEQRLASVPPETREDRKVVWPWADWEKSIISRPDMWQALVPEPPPPPPPKPPEPERPKMDEMLKDVTPTRRGMGAKVRIITAQNPRGDYYQVGDNINGCVIDEVTKTEVVFSYYWAAKKEKLTLSKPRE